MRIDRVLAALIIAAILTVGSAGQAQQRFPVPPPPPPPYDPIPGPYLIMLDDQGEMADDDQMGIIDNAWSAWRGPKLEIFTICYFHPVGSKVDWKIALRALDLVANALKARGASVVTPAMRTCDAAQASFPDRQYVKILGLVRT